MHSKQRGDGFVDTPAKVRALVEAVGSVSGGAVELEQGLVVVDADQVEGEEDEEPPSNASLCFSLFTLAVSIPALIGA